MGHIGTKLRQKYDKFDKFYINYRQFRINCQGLERLIYCGFKWSGRQDLNLRPPAPHAGALPNCATSRYRKSYINYILMSLPASAGNEVQRSSSSINSPNPRRRYFCPRAYQSTPLMWAKMPV